MIRRFLAVAAVLVIAAPARAANKDLERLYIQVAALQSQIADLQRATEDSLKEVRRLNEVVAEQSAALRRSVDDQRVREEQFQNALKDFTERLSELGERLDAVRAATAASAPAASVYTPSGGAAPQQGAAPPVGAASPAPAPASVPPPRELYSQAYTDYARGNYDLAIQGYQEYLRYYPETDFADNAQYWIGECLYSKQKYAEAMEAWDELFRKYPASDKLPDARLKKGLALERLGRRREALREYRFVVDRYPNTEAARKARDKIGAP